MKVKCVSNTTKYLLPETMLVGYPEKYEFDVNMGGIYTVYSIITLGQRFLFLLAEDSDTPFWYPSELFEIKDSLLPTQWYFGFRHGKKKEKISFLGYKEMVVDEDHYNALIECDLDAMKIFEKRKQEIDEWEALRKKQNN